MLESKRSQYSLPKLDGSAKRSRLCLSYSLILHPGCRNRLKSLSIFIWEIHFLFTLKYNEMLCLWEKSKDDKNMLENIGDLFVK